MNAFVAMQPTVRLAALALLGLLVGGLVNAAIYALAWNSRPISPWQRRHPQAPPRCALDFFPVVGWLGLRRESSLHGRGFWIRPLLIELLCAFGLPALCWWEMAGRLTPDLPVVFFVPATAAMLAREFVSHALLFLLMLAATFIDFDEKTIPDEITIPGTLLGLMLAAVWPDSHLPVVGPITPPPTLGYAPLLFTSTSEWPAWLNQAAGLLLGISIFTAWCIALIPALATLRRGWWKGVQFYLVSVIRDSAWWKLLALAAIGNTAIFVVWRGGGASWQALLTSLVGVAFGGGLVWAVRIAGRVSLGKEAMGFGDVTLLAMIGAFLGWQPCLMIFFLSPFAALLIALIQVALTGRRDIPYGPYLCAAAVVVIIQWPALWNNFSPLFAMGWLVPSILGICGVLMVALLTIWRWIESSFLR